MSETVPIYPAKPQPPNQSYLPSKAQLYGAPGRPMYRPPPKHRSRRSCCCTCFKWTSILILILILLAGIAAAAIYVIYRPHRPIFRVGALQIPQLNLTTTASKSHVNSNISLSVTAKNRNKKIIYFYDDFTFLVKLKSNGVYIGNGSFHSFVLGKKNTTTLKTSVKSDERELETDDATKLKDALKKTSGMNLVVQLETKARVKIGSFKSKKIKLRITCSGVKAVVLKGKVSAGSSSLTSSSDPECKIDARIKIWKWTF